MKIMRFRIRKALKKYRELCEYGCLKIPCRECKYLVQVNKHLSTCERERLMKMLLPKHKKQVDAVDTEFYK